MNDFYKNTKAVSKGASLRYADICFADISCKLQ